jgi:Fe2+ transport system protein FeoA
MMIAVTWPTTMPIGVDPGAVVEVTDRAVCSDPIASRRGVWPHAVRADGRTA